MNSHESHIHVIREVSIFCKVSFSMCKNDEACYMYATCVLTNIAVCKRSHFSKEYSLIYQNVNVEKHVIYI